MAALRSPFRYDFVGSFLRPQAIKNARAQFKAGEITRDELTAVENEQITLLVEKQKRAGYHGITDGEFRPATGTWTLCGALLASTKSNWTTATTSRVRKRPTVLSASVVRSAARITPLWSILNL